MDKNNSKDEEKDTGNLDKQVPEKSEKKKPEPAKPIALPPLIFASGLIIGFIFDSFIFRTNFYDSKFIVIIGYIVISAGIIFALFGLQIFLQMKENPHPHTETNKLIIKGIFKYSRNPLYVAMAFIYTGMSIILNSLAMLIMFAPVIMIINYGVIIREEKYLSQLFGDEFLEYKKQVRKWL